MNLSHHLILASKSPRRQELLRSLELDFEIRIRSIEETFSEDLPSEKVAEFLALQKSAAFDDLKDDELVLTSDTTVVVEGEILNKADNAEHAKSMLQLLSNKSHRVITGVCLRTNQTQISFSEQTTVQFKKLSNDEIEHYIQVYKPFDKAGAYGIQEWIGKIGITSIEGDYYNVMGLPLHRLYNCLKENFSA